MQVLIASRQPSATQSLRRALPEADMLVVNLDRADGANDYAAVVASGVLATVDAIVPLRGVIDRQVIRGAARCRIIQQFGSGLDTVDAAAAVEHGVPVCNVPSAIGGNGESVAELALMHLIAAGRRLRDLEATLGRGELSEPVGTSLFGKTVCVVGFGGIGRALAELLHPFRCRVLVVRRTPDRGPITPVEEWPTRRLKEALGLADFVVVAVPLTAETEDMIDTDEIAAMRPGSHLINVARGSVVSQAALLDGLARGQIGAVGLDVYWDEPPPKTLVEALRPHGILTPHAGGVTDHMLEHTSHLVAGNIRAALRDEDPRFRVA